MDEAKLYDSEPAVARLPADLPWRREPRWRLRRRPAEFAARFDDRTLVYDAFWHADGGRIVLVCPPPMNLGRLWTAMRIVAQPSGVTLSVKRHASVSVMLVALEGAPPGTDTISLIGAGFELDLPVGSNLSPVFAGRRVLFSMNRNNDLAWIAEWAHWHAHHHGTDAVVLFDNGSTRYGAEDVELTLAAVPGIEAIAVPRWPGRFGMFDPAVRINPYWAHFLQIASMSVALRRFGAEAYGLLNCDIDELCVSDAGASVYELARTSRHGLVGFSGQWVEATGRASDLTGAHRDYTSRLVDPEARRSAPRKWVLDPGRSWVENLAVHPYWHWIDGRPLFGKTEPKDLSYRHFRAINTAWKERRAIPPQGPVERDTVLDRGFAPLWGDKA